MDEDETITERAGGFLPLNTRPLQPKPSQNMPSVVRIVGPITDSPSVMERGQRAEAVQSCLVIALFVNLDVSSRWVNPISDLNDDGLGLPDSVSTP